jgi:hypothetical protein
MHVELLINLESIQRCRVYISRLFFPIFLDILDYKGPKKGRIIVG